MLGSKLYVAVSELVSSDLHSDLCPGPFQTPRPSGAVCETVLNEVTCISAYLSVDGLFDPFCIVRLMLIIDRPHIPGWVDAIAIAFRKTMATNTSFARVLVF